MKINILNNTLFALATSTLLLSGCGSSNNSTSTVNTTTSGTIIKGVLVNAKVCIDLNKNNMCDTNEPFDMTDINGKYSIEGRYTSPIVVESTSSSIDKSTSKPFVGFMYASSASGTVNDITMFTTINKIMADNNLSNTNLAKVFGINENYLSKDFITATDLNSSEKDKLEKASQFIKQFISSSIQNIKDSNVTISETNSTQYYAVAQGFSKYLNDNNTTDLSNIDQNISLTKSIKKEIISNIDKKQLDITSKIADINNTIDANTTAFEVVDSVSNELESMLKSLYSVPVLNNDGTVTPTMTHQLHDFNISSYAENLADSNITISGMINNSAFSTTLSLDKTSGLYGAKIDDNQSFAINLNFREKGMTNSGMLLIYGQDTNGDNITDNLGYWGLQTASKICKEYNGTTSLNTINTFYTNNINCN